MPLYNAPGVWMYTGHLGGIPIFGSCNDLRRIGLYQNNDSCLILPGYQFILYPDLSGGGTAINNFDNSGTKIQYIQTTTANAGKSCKLYFGGTELTETTVYNYVNV